MSMTAEQYIESLYEKDGELQQVIRGIEEAKMPQISIASGYGRLLTLLVSMTKAKRILEIGALGGYSGICLARGLDDGGRLLSLELETEYAEVARKHLQMAGLEDKVDYRIGDARQSMDELIQEGKRFDFFFIDANKTGYPDYLSKAIELANPGAVIVGDNTLQHGKILDPEIRSNAVEAMREFNRRIAADPRLESTILPAYDGLAIARVKESV